MIVLVYLSTCLVPVAALRLFTHGLPRLGAVLTRLRVRRRARRGEDRVSERERYRKDLRRLAADHDELMRCERPARANRMRAIERAYDETLLRACLAMDIDLDLDPDVAQRGLDPTARVQLEADLLVHGLTW